MQRIRNFFVVLVLLSMMLMFPSVSLAQPDGATRTNVVASISVPGTITQGARFNATVRLNNTSMTTVHCVRANLTLSGGYRSLTSQPQQVSSIYGGRSATVQFGIAAPSTVGAVGTAQLLVEWYDTSRCNTTPYRTQTSAQLKVGPSGSVGLPPWKLTVVVFPNKAVDESVPVQITVVDSSGRQVGVKWITPDRIPYVATFDIPSKLGDYTVRAVLAYIVVTRVGEMRIPGAGQARVQVTRSGQSVDIYPR